MKTNISKCSDINRIEFIVTYQCGGKCKHCQVGAGLNKRGTHRHVLADYAVEAVGKLAQAFDITSVMTFGGEPLYFPEVVAAIHKKATDCGIQTRQLITNGYFTNSASESRKVADLLSASGVNNLLLSVDAFHQEAIPIEPVRRFAADIAKIPGAFLYPAWVVDENHNNPYNERTREILAKFSDINLPVKNNNITLIGNAEQFLSGYYEKPMEDYDPFEGLPPSINVEPDGLIKIGDVDGNIYEEDISAIITRYMSTTGENH